MSVKPVISKPLDHIEPFTKQLKSSSIDVISLVPGAPGFSGVKLVDATAQEQQEQQEQTIQTIQTISDKELEAMSAQPQISDLSDFNIAPTDSVIDATDFPTISNVEPIIDNVSIDTKEIKESKK